MVSIEISNELCEELSKIANFLRIDLNRLANDILKTEIESLKVDPSNILGDYLEGPEILKLIFKS